MGRTIDIHEQINIQIQRLIICIDVQMISWKDRQIDKLTDRNRQIDKQIDRQKKGEKKAKKKEVSERERLCVKKCENPLYIV